MIQRLLDAVIFFGLMALIVATSIPYGGVESWSQAAFAAVVFSLTALWAIHALIAGEWRAGNLRLFYPLIALIVFAVLQSLSWAPVEVAGIKVVKAISADPFESRIFALRLAALTLAGILAVRFTISSARLAFLVYTIIFVALLSAVFGMLRQAMQHDYGFVLPSLRFGGGYAQFINRNHFAFLVEPAIGLLLGIALCSRARRERLLIYLSAILILWVALIMSGSRGGLLAVTVQVICAALFFMYSKQRKSHSRVRNLLVVAGITSVALLVITIGGVVWLGGDQLTSGVETASVELKTMSGLHVGARRRDIWYATWRMASAHPIVGAGLGGYWAALPIYHEATGLETPQQAHNDYLELLASGGLVGAVIFIWFAVMLTRQARRALQISSGFQYGATVGALLGIVAVAIHSLVEFGLHTTVNALVCMMLLSILCLDRLDQRSKAQVHRN